MRSRKAFTLIEMLAVISIMLILMTVTFGMFRLFAERTGPDAVMSQIQAVIHSARDYAVSSGEVAGVFFYSYEPDTNNPFQTVQSTPRQPLEGTLIKILRWNASPPGCFEEIPGYRPISLGNQTYVIREMPDVSNLMSGLQDLDRDNPNPADAVRWRQYEQKVMEEVSRHVFSGGAGTPLDTAVFYIEFGPAGYPPGTPKRAANTVQNGMTIVKVAGRRVTAYGFYQLNTNTGTRIFFE